MKKPHPHVPRSYERTTIEAALMDSSEPMSVEDVSAATGLELEVCRIHVHKCVTVGLAFNTAKIGVAGLYVWGQPEKPPAVERTLVMHQPVYVPPKPFCARGEAAMVAYGLPSVRNGERVQPGPLMLMGGSLG